MPFFNGLLSPTGSWHKANVATMTDGHNNYDLSHEDFIMKAFILIPALFLSSSLVLAGEPFGNPDLFDGYGAVLTSAKSGNENPNQDLYGNGYGETEAGVEMVKHIDFSRLSANAGGNEDLYGGI